MIQGHGGNVFAVAQQLGCRPEEIIDMSSNINPLGALPGLIDHLKERLDRIRVLPEVDGRAAIQAIAALLGVAPERVLAGGGTTQFIYTACAALRLPAGTDRRPDLCRLYRRLPGARYRARFFPGRTDRRALPPTWNGWKRRLPATTRCLSAIPTIPPAS